MTGGLFDLSGAHGVIYDSWRPNLLVAVHYVFHRTNTTTKILVELLKFLIAKI